MSHTKSLPQFPFEIVEMIAGFLTDDNGNVSIVDLNAFVNVNRLFYRSLNHTLWQAAARCTSTAEHIFTYLIRTTQLARLKFFLSLGADVETHLQEFDGDITNYDMDEKILTKTTPLKIAAEMDRTDMARLFLDHGADVVQYDKDGHPGYSAIHVSSSREMVQMLLDAKADPNQLALHGYRPLHYYALRDNIEAMRIILKKGAEVDVTAGTCQSTPLHQAAAHSLDAVKLLLHHGAQSKPGGRDMRTPVQVAAIKGKTKIVMFLLEIWPEDLCQMTGEEDTLLHLAAESGIIALARFLVASWPGALRFRNCFGHTPLHSAAGWEMMDMARFLVESWPQGLQERGVGGDTPLHVAAEAGKTDMARFLVKSWPQGLQERDVGGNTPLHVAAEAGMTAVTRFLVKRWPAGLRAQNDDGITPQQLAALRGSFKWPDCCWNIYVMGAA
jgi:ankyrin repeat protein